MLTERPVDDAATKLLASTPRLEAALDETALRLRASTVHVLAGDVAGGAGLVVEPGRVVTNAHVVTGSPVHVETADGRRVRARVERRDTWRDLALLETEAHDPVPAPLGDETSLRPGSVVVALGHPLGWAGALALGIVHRVARDGPAASVRWIHADVRLAPGNSGGPLADAGGRVVGINAMVANGLGIAVPVSALRRFLVAPARRPRLGVRMRPIEVRVHGGRRGIGLLVVDTIARGAAERAGVRAGDVLIGADGVRFAAPFDLTDALALATAATMRIELVRNGSVREIDAPVDQPDPGARAA